MSAPYAPQISFIITCKGRLTHLRQTVPSLLSDLFDATPEQMGCEVIVVDYDCPERTDRWIAENFKEIKVAKVSGEEFFNLSRARNIGAQKASGRWLCFLDADNRVNAGFRRWLSNNIKESFFYLQEKESPSLDLPKASGILICTKENFLKVGGYDEAFASWGGEDLDIQDRLIRVGIIPRRFPHEFIHVLDHDDSLRTAFYKEKEKYKSYMISRYYMHIKQFMMGTLGRGRDLPLDARKKIMMEITDAFGDWAPGMQCSIKSKGFVFNHTFQLGRKLKMEKRIKIEIDILEDFA